MVRPTPAEAQYDQVPARGEKCSSLDGKVIGFIPGQVQAKRLKNEEGGGLNAGDLNWLFVAFIRLVKTPPSKPVQGALKGAHALEAGPAVNEKDHPHGTCIGQGGRR